MQRRNWQQEKRSRLKTKTDRWITVLIIRLFNRLIVTAWETMGFVSNNGKDVCHEDTLEYYVAKRADLTYIRV